MSWFDTLSRFGSLALGAYGAWDTQRQQDRAVGANEGRYNEGLDLYRGLRDRILGGYGGVRDDAEQNYLRYSDYVRAGYRPIQEGYDRIGENVRQGYDEIGEDVLPGYRGRTQYAIEGGGDIAGDVGAGYDALSQGYGDRYTRGMALLRDLGGQEREDITEAYGADENTAIADLTSRGLAGTSIAPSVRTGIGRERTNALGRLEERLRREQFAADTGLSGDQLMAQERGIGAGADARTQALLNYLNTSGQELGTRERLGLGELAAGTAADEQSLSAREGAYGRDVENYRALIEMLRTMDLGELGLDQELTGNIGNWIYNREDAYPNQNAYLQLAQLIGQGAAPAPQVPGTDYATPAIGAAGQIGGGATTAVTFKVLLGGCIDGEAMVDTSLGEKKLKDIQIGDDVLSHNGTFSKVVEKDYGLSRRPDEFIQIDNDCEVGKNGDLRRLILTRDHIVDGKPAKGWGRLALPVSAVPCGDLRLANDEGYYANGFKVASMLSIYAHAE